MGIEFYQELYPVPIEMMGFPGSSHGKESACNARDLGSIPRKISWRKEWQLTPVFLPGEFHGQRNLVGCSPWGHKESDMTEQLPLHFILTLPLLAKSNIGRN